MTHAILADLVLVLHLAFILFVVAGGFLALRWRSIGFLHLPAVLWGVYIEVSGGICPLTPIENALRGAAGTGVYSSSFIEHYLTPLIYPGSLTHSTQLLLAGFVVLANVLAYSIVWRHSKNSPSRSHPRRSRARG